MYRFIILSLNCFNIWYISSFFLFLEVFPFEEAVPSFRLYWLIAGEKSLLSAPWGIPRLCRSFLQLPLPHTFCPLLARNAQDCMFLVLGSVSFFPIRLTSIHKGWNAVPSGRTEHQPQDGGVQDEMCAALEVPESHLGRVTGKVTLLTESAKQLVGFQSRCCPPSTSRGSHCPDPGPLSVPPSAIRGGIKQCHIHLGKPDTHSHTLTFSFWRNLWQEGPSWPLAEGVTGEVKLFLLPCLVHPVSGWCPPPDSQIPTTALSSVVLVKMSVLREVRWQKTPAFLRVSPSSIIFSYLLLLSFVTYLNQLAGELKSPVAGLCSVLFLLQSWGSIFGIYWWDAPKKSPQTSSLS